MAAKKRRNAQKKTTQKTAQKTTQKKAKRKKHKKGHPNLGGRRPGAGRKPVGLRSGVAHRARPKFTSKDYVHVTFRVLDELPNLEQEEVTQAITESIEGAPRVPGFRIERFSIRFDHVHLILKARSRPLLANAMQGLSVRLARRLNAMWNRRGTIFADRYDAQVLSTSDELENTLAVLRSPRCGMRGTQRCPSAKAVGKRDPNEKKVTKKTRKKASKKKAVRG